MGIARSVLASFINHKYKIKKNILCNIIITFTPTIKLLFGITQEVSVEFILLLTQMCNITTQRLQIHICPILIGVYDYVWIADYALLSCYLVRQTKMKTFITIVNNTIIFDVFIFCFFFP